MARVDAAVGERGAGDVVAVGDARVVVLPSSDLRPLGRRSDESGDGSEAHVGWMDTWNLFGCGMGATKVGGVRPIR